MDDNRPKRNRHICRFRERRVTPRDVKPLGLGLVGEDYHRMNDLEKCDHVPQPPVTLRGDWEPNREAVKCAYCRSEFTNGLALSWHEYVSHKAECVEDGMTFNEYLGDSA